MSTITHTGSGDVQEVLTLLERCGLPKAGLDASLSTILVAREGEKVVGCAALEVYGTIALLRSIAIDPAHRSHGLGQQMVQEHLAHARGRGIQQVYLLTETAADYFPRFGFRLIERCAVPPALHQSMEWTSACPVSAQVMVLHLESV